MIFPMLAALIFTAATLVIALLLGLDKHVCQRLAHQKRTFAIFHGSTEQEAKFALSDIEPPRQLVELRVSNFSCIVFTFNINR